MFSSSHQLFEIYISTHITFLFEYLIFLVFTTLPCSFLSYIWLRIYRFFVDDKLLLDNLLASFGQTWSCLIFIKKGGLNGFWEWQKNVARELNQFVWWAYMTSASKKFLDEFVVVMGLGYQKNLGNLPGNILEVLIPTWMYPGKKWKYLIHLMPKNIKKLILD